MKFHGELLIFVMLMVTNLRVFFVRHVRRDPLVVLAPFTFILSLLQIFAWGIDIVSAFAFILSLLVLFSNFHAIFRYIESLYIDHYSALMKVWAVCTVSLSILSIFVLIVFSPVEDKSNKIGVKEEIHRVEGSFRSGFKTAGSFRIADAFIYEFSILPPIKSESKNEKNEAPVESTAQADSEVVQENSEVAANAVTVNEVAAAETVAQVEAQNELAENEVSAESEIHTAPVILFFPDKRADTMNYKPYLQQLALLGNHVYSADYYSNDCRWLHSFGDNKIFRRSIMVIQSFVRPAFFESQREYYSYNIKLEAEALLKFVFADKENFTCVMICDAMGHSALQELQQQYPEQISKIIFLDEIPEYKTPGYGIIEQTNPILSHLLNLPKDSSKQISKNLAEKTVEIMQNESL